MEMLDWILILAWFAMSVGVVIYLVLRHEITTRARKKANRARDDKNAQFLRERQWLHHDIEEINPVLVYYLDQTTGMVRGFDFPKFRQVILALELQDMGIPKSCVIIDCDPLGIKRYCCGSISWKFGNVLTVPTALIDHRGHRLSVVLDHGSNLDQIAEVLRIMEHYHTVTEYASAYRMLIADERIASTRSAFRSPALAEARGLLQTKNIKPFSECHRPDASLLVGVI